MALHRAEFRGRDSADRAVPTSTHGTGAGLRSSAQGGGIRAISRLSQPVFRIVFITFLLWRTSPPRFAAKTAAWAGADAPGFGATPNLQISTHEFATVQAGRRSPPFARTLADCGGLFSGGELSNTR